MLLGTSPDWEHRRKKKSLIGFAHSNFQLTIKVTSRAYPDDSLFTAISSKRLVFVPEQLNPSPSPFARPNAQSHRS